MKKTVTLLAGASWLLLGVAWLMSIYAYFRLPAEIALWTSLWSHEVVRAAKSLAFFVLPVTQTVIFVVSLILARLAFFRDSSPDAQQGRSDGPAESRLLILQKEVTFLALIFFNLIFIHLQTSLILISHGLSQGINRYYVAMLLAVLVILIPYYRVRRRILQ